MALPKNLNTYVTDNIVIKPELAFHKKTMEPAIYVEVIDRGKNSILEARLLQTEAEYEAFAVEMTNKYG